MVFMRGRRSAPGDRNRPERSGGASFCRMNSVLKRCAHLLAVLCLGSLGVHAETVTWTNTAGGAWSLAANWSPNKVPVAADTAQITNSGTYLVTLDSATEVTHLQVGAASGTQTFRLTPSGSLTVTGTATFATNAPVEWTGGTLHSSLTDPSLIAVNTPFTSTGLLDIPSGVTVFARIGGSNTIAGAVQLGTIAILHHGSRSGTFTTIVNPALATLVPT